MPHGELHRRQRGKNLALFAALLAFCALFYGLTLVRMGGKLNPNTRLALNLAAMAAGMVMLAYAFVPLYDLFCRITGTGGTTQVAVQAPATISDRAITVRFNADTDPHLPWTFKPEQASVSVRLGEQKLISYLATNEGKAPATGTAIYNVTPHKYAPYFNKIQCFCFEKQTLGPGETKHFPVSFFVDPALLEDETLRDIDTITLSYTFFPEE